MIAGASSNAVSRPPRAGLLVVCSVVLSRYRGRRSRSSLRRFKMSERKELVHDETASTNDRGSTAAELFAAHDPVLHRGRGGLRPALRQAARPTGAGAHPRVSTAPG